jgi:O-antigen ligase
MIVGNLVLGVGMNNFTVRMLDYASLGVAGFWMYAVHNNFLLIWAETGTGALMAYLAFLATTLWRGWKCWLAQDHLLSPLALGFSLAIVGHMVHMLFDLFNGRGPMQALWFNAGLVTALFCIYRENKDAVQIQ